MSTESSVANIKSLDDICFDMNNNGIDAVKMLILYKLVTMVCKQKDNYYVFTHIAETEENYKFIDEWFDVIMKVCPAKNINVFRNRKKRLLTVVRHLCKSLKHKGFLFFSKSVRVVKGNKSTTEYTHFIKYI